MKKMSDMVDKLDALFELQMMLADKCTRNEYDEKTVDGKVSLLCTAMIHEVVELQRETNWKWWKTPVEFNLSNAKEELIDVLHFVIQCAIEMDMTPDEIVKVYKSKHEENVRRQEDGY